jgi:signal transduction histidine kinase
MSIEGVNTSINSDEKRIKQVLMNLQSNALKFTKTGGQIHIIAEYIQPSKNDKKIKRKNTDYYAQFTFSTDSESQGSGDSDVSEYQKFEQLHGVEQIYFADKNHPKLVITVIDTGIGIKRQEKLKLFKLFGTLQSTMQMNTAGIGLGLVISENIITAFSGKIGVDS